MPTGFWRRKPTLRQTPASKRIWELDALRGFCVLAMVGLHLIWDLSSLWGFPLGSFLTACMRWGGGVFFLLAGVCVTLGHRPVRRGLTVLSCGLLCSAATAALYLLGVAGSGILIYFGTLHCLGLCMLSWPVLCRISAKGLLLLGTLLSAAGVYLSQSGLPGSFWLLPFGLLPEGLATADYFPLLPFWGIFLLGTYLGRKLYPQPKSVFVCSPPAWLRPLCACGRKALPIYLLHQPVITAVVFLAAGAFPA